MSNDDWLDQISGGESGRSTAPVPSYSRPAARRGTNPLTVVWVAALGTLVVVCTLCILSVAAMRGCGRVLEEDSKRAATQERAADAATPPRRPPAKR